TRQTPDCINRCCWRSSRRTKTTLPGEESLLHVEEREQLTDFPFVGLAAILADLERLGIFDLFAALLAVPADESVPILVRLAPRTAVPALAKPRPTRLRLRGGG